MSQPLSPTANKLARAILGGFESMLADFLNITLGAQARFENADWQAIHNAMRDRLRVYDQKVDQAVNIVKIIGGPELYDNVLWREAKGQYAKLVAEHENALIAQTFFNSVFGRVFGHDRIREVHIFIVDEKYAPTNRPVDEIVHSLVGDDLHDLFIRLMQLFQFRLPYEDLARDVGRVVDVLQASKYGPMLTGECRIEFGTSLFFRNKGAYILGRITSDAGVLPFFLPILNNEQGAVYIDTVLFEEEKISMLFSFTRAYFMVDTDKPVRYVRFLETLMPHKKRFELFNAIGFVKHAKTEFYRFKVDFTRNLAPESKYIIAPGIKGMVMLVFTIPESEYVYKVIKDKFTPPKKMTRTQVIERYNMVKRSDRVGRMADTHEFRYLAFDRSRFSDELLAELEKEAPSQIEISGNALVFKHIYVERKMIPLNLYLTEATEEGDMLAIRHVMKEYGNAIKQMAAANIFPGDMLLKNFGVTRHRRVVFYDYDEICPLVECNFRKIPKPRNDEEIYAQGAWFNVAENDVFPEEFELFFSGNALARDIFNELHSDIYDHKFWRGLQENICAGNVADVFPYTRQWRFEQR